MENKKQYVIVFVITTVAVIVYLSCHHFNLSYPVIFNEDKAIDNFIKSVALEGNKVEIGMFVTCEYNIQNIIIFFLIKILGNTWAGINVYYIFSFFMISFSMYCLLKKLEIPIEISVGLSVLSAFLPFHIDRGEGQIMTSNFFLVPLFLCMFYDLVYYKKLELHHKRYIVLVFLAPFIDIRISIMTVLLFIIFLVQCYNEKNVKSIIYYFTPLFLVTFIVGILSSTLKVSDIELAKEEGMRILDMVMPMRYHISGRLSDIRLEYDILLSAHGESGLNSLGVLFSIGFVCMMLGVFFEWKKDRRIAWMGMISIIVILIAGICGIGSVIEYLGINITYWSRMAVYIAVCSVVVIGILAGHIVRWIESRNDKKYLLTCNVVIYLVFVLEFFELILRRNM